MVSGKPKVNWFVILPAVVAGAAGPIGYRLMAPKAQESRALQALEKNPRAKAAFETVMKPIMDEPAFKQRLEAGIGREPALEMAVVATGGPAAALSQQLAAQGALRLPAKEYMALQAVKLELARKSPKVCAGMWSGGITEEELVGTIEKLSDQDLRRYFELGGQALRLELQTNQPLPRFERAAVLQGIEEIAGALPSAEQQALLQTVEAGVNVPPEAGCKAMTHLLVGALRMPPERGARFIAGLTNPALLDG